MKRLLPLLLALASAAPMPALSQTVSPWQRSQRPLAWPYEDLQARLVVQGCALRVEFTSHPNPVISSSTDPHPVSELMDGYYALKVTTSSGQRKMNLDWQGKVLSPDSYTDVQILDTWKARDRWGFELALAGGTGYWWFDTARFADHCRF